MQNSLLPSPQNPGESLPPAATGLTGADLARLRRSLDSSVSDNTRTMYNSAWSSFESWAQAHGAQAMPASPPLVAAYLAWLAEERRRQWPPSGSTRLPWPRSTRLLATPTPPTTRA